MKIETKEDYYCLCHKGNRNTGNINRMWRDVHKKARHIWKRQIWRHEYEALIKRC
jgi:hypothetical protein